MHRQIIFWQAQEQHPVDSSKSTNNIRMMNNVALAQENHLFCKTPACSSLIPPSKPAWLHSQRRPNQLRTKALCVPISHKPLRPAWLHSQRHSSSLALPRLAVHLNLRNSLLFRSTCTGTQLACRCFLLRRDLCNHGFLLCLISA